MRIIRFFRIAPIIILGFTTLFFNSSIASQQEAYGSGLSTSTILDLNDLKTNPNNYDWFDFRPNLKKLILSGAADTEHVSILWYTISNGSVGLHYHSMTESVYAIDGQQTDGKGTYPTGTVYFNPLGSGHEIWDSSGFFILAYASPPDFVNTDLIEEYQPVRIDIADPDLENLYPFKRKKRGVWVYDLPLDKKGGMNSEIIKSTSTKSYKYKGNYLLVIRGSCNIDGTNFGKDMLIVATTVELQTYRVTATENYSCLAMGVSF